MMEKYPFVWGWNEKKGSKFPITFKGFSKSCWDRKGAHFGFKTHLLQYWTLKVLVGIEM